MKNKVIKISGDNEIAVKEYCEKNGITQTAFFTDAIERKLNDNLNIERIVLKKNLVSADISVNLLIKLLNALKIEYNLKDIIEKIEDRTDKIL